jgi:hypothetical protein
VLELIVLLIFMIAAGIVAVEIKDLLASVIALGLWPSRLRTSWPR